MYSASPMHLAYDTFGSSRVRIFLSLLRLYFQLYSWKLRTNCVRYAYICMLHCNVSTLNKKILENTIPPTALLVKRLLTSTGCLKKINLFFDYTS